MVSAALPLTELRESAELRWIVDGSDSQFLLNKDVRSLLIKRKRNRDMFPKTALAGLKYFSHARSFWAGRPDCPDSS